MGYKGIIGQKSSVKYLKKAVESGKTNHSLIFEGEEGMGKMTLAKEYAKSLFCAGDDKPCGQCVNCRKFEHGNLLDFKIIAPKSKKSVSTEDISDMLSDAFLIPNEGGRKVYIVQKAHLMTAAAQNKLLKILEEPPEYLNLMLLCDNISNILPTIISRCVTLKMQKLTEEDIQKELMSRGHDETTASNAAALSSGNLGYALMISEDKNALEKFAEYRKMFYEIHTNKIEAFSYLDKKRGEIGAILICWQKILSDCLKIKTVEGFRPQSEDEINYAQKHGIDDIIDKLTYILQAESRITGNAQYMPTVDWLLSNL